MIYKKLFKPVVIGLFCILSACQRVPDQIEPTLNYAVQDRYLKALPSPFLPLSSSELLDSWGQEYLIGITFARQLDLYQAITAFKRAEILLSTNHSRKLEIQYEILLCYYVGHKYQHLIDIFERSPLRHIDPNFPACHDLLMIVHDSYLQLGDLPQADRILYIINQFYPEQAIQLALSDALITAQFPVIEQFAGDEQFPYLPLFLQDYAEQKKSVTQAQLFNTFLPGAGYLYLGQTQSAITAFLLNGLFIAAAAQFFIHDHLAAGIICTSFEMGWYFGGIFGAGLAAKYHNERLYERLATPMMNQQKLFPILMLNYAF